MRNNFAKKLGMSLAAFGLVATSMFTGTDAEAVPAFARQTGMPCNACHFQNFPSLNAMGRSFKSGGYTMEGSQSSIEGENQLKLPSAMNVSGIAKIRHVSTNETGDDYGEVQWPDEAALLIGGRMSANAGFLYEIGLAKQGLEAEGHADLTTGDVTVEGESDGNYLSTKFVFIAANTGSIQFNVIPFSTDGLGPGYGFDLMNTGSTRSIRYIEDRKAMSAFQPTGISTGKAEGIALVAAASNWFVNYSLWGPIWGNGDVDFGGLAAYIRAVYFTNLAGFDLGVGYTMTSGSVTTEASSEVENDDVVINIGSNSGIDVQAQGDLGGMAAAFWLSTASVAEADAAADDEWIAVNGAQSATSFGTKVSVTPEINVFLAMGTHATVVTENNVNTDVVHSRTAYGVQYMIAQNLRFDFNMSSHSTDIAGSEAVNETMLMLFMGM